MRARARGHGRTAGSRAIDTRYRGAVAPNAHEVRRALARAERGAALDPAEATALLAARGEQLDALCAVAARVRDAGLVAAGRPGVVTYSPKVFIPVTRLCRDRCHYCTFVTVPGKLAARRTCVPTRSSRSPRRAPRWAAWRRCSRSATGRRTAGPRPGSGWTRAATTRRSPTSGRWRSGCWRRPGCCRTSTPGVMSWEEMNRLKPVAPSMGMMLETTSTRLFETKGEAHHGSPDKDPAVRLRVLEDAGRLSVPFTSGLLVGIGETLAERADTIFALRANARRLRRAAGSDRPELPGQAGHRDATHRRPAAGGVPRRDRGHPDRDGPQDARPGPAQPGLAGGVHRAARRRRRRLGWRLPAHPRPREPRAPLAVR